MTFSSLVSVIIPTFNRSDLLERALRSAVSQRYSHIEIIVVDNNSSDNTDSIVRRFGDARIKLYKIDNKGIIASSRNFGVKMSHGEYIAFLDSDDWWTEEKIQRSVERLEMGFDVVYHDAWLVYKREQGFFLRKAKTWDVGTKTTVLDDLIERGNALVTSSVVLRKSLLNKVDGFIEDRRLLGIEDYDAWLRIAEIGGKYSRISSVDAFYWKGGGNMSTDESVLRRLENIRCILTARYKNISEKIVWIDWELSRIKFRQRQYKKSLEYLMRHSSLSYSRRYPRLFKHKFIFHVYFIFYSACLNLVREIKSWSTFKMSRERFAIGENRN